MSENLQDSSHYLKVVGFHLRETKGFFMNKNEENSTKSSTWAGKQLRKEADELVKKLETEEEFNVPEPSENLFQKLVDQARDEGLLEEENTKHLEDETKSTEENTKENQNTRVVKFFNHRISKKFLGMTAAAVITCFGLFGVSMSTQGGRSYVMDKAKEVLGDEENTEIENGEDRLITDRTEEEARNEIEEKLQVEVPTFLYLPDRMDFDSYEIDETAQSVYIRYKKDNDYIYFVIQANYVDKSGIYRNDEGNCLGKVSNNMSDIEAEVWEIKDEEEEISTYLAQWDYKNSYYRISGRITRDEIENIIKDIVY